MRPLRYSTILQLAFTGISAILYLAGCLILLGIQGRQNQTELNYLLYSEVEALASYLAAGGGLDFPELVRLDSGHTPGPIWLRVVRDGNVVAATPGIPDLPADWRGTVEQEMALELPDRELPTVSRQATREDTPQSESEGTLRTLEDAQGRALVGVEHLVWNQPNTHVQAFMRPRLIDRRLRSMLHSLLLTGAILLPISLIASRYLTRSILQPVQRLMQQVDAISPDDLSQRVTAHWQVIEIAALARVFNRMLSRVEVAVHRVQRFTANASHELRTPLASLRTSLQVCLRRPRSEEEYREMGSEMLVEIERLSRSVESLLLLARLDQRDSEGVPVAEPADLRAVVETARRALAPLVAERGLRLRLEVPEELPEIRGNAAHLELMLINLLDNAVKHSPAGGEVTVTVTAAPTTVRLRVQDEGAGIPEKDRAFIFERHYQGHASVRPSSSRVGGIGLDVVRWVVRRHGGEVELIPQERGACFEVSLPTDPPPAPSPEATASTASADTSEAAAPQG